MRSNRPTRHLLVVGATAAAALALTACSNGGEGGDVAPTPETTTAAESTMATTSATAEPEATETSGTSTRETSTSRSSTATSTRTSRNASSDDELGEDVEAVAEQFETLAPRSLFEEFESCHATGLEGSFECSGSQVGQFQFFDSQSKAASTTQLLTELRSSRVVEDTGRKVVGWSTLGTTAVVTVVDNELGLVAQQLVSSDLEDPEERIYELGLADPPAASSSSTSPASRDRSADFNTADERLAL